MRVNTRGVTRPTEPKSGETVKFYPALKLKKR